MTKGYRQILFSYFLLSFDNFLWKINWTWQADIWATPISLPMNGSNNDPIDWRWTLKTFNALHRDVICRISVRWNYYITATNKRTDVWSRNFIIWKINCGLRSWLDCEIKVSGRLWATFEACFLWTKNWFKIFLKMF